MMASLHRLGALGLVLSLGLAAAALSAGAHAPGPPMICTPFETADHPTLPEKSPPDLARATLALLTPEVPAVVRMETIRRSLMQARDTGVRRDIFTSLQSRVLDAEAGAKGSADAWFDAAYFAAAWSELDTQAAPEVGMARACVGYSWFKKALALSPDSPAFDFGAALAVHPAMHKGTHELYREHLARAAAGAAPGSLLEKNIRNHCVHWSESFDALRTKGQDLRATAAPR